METLRVSEFLLLKDHMLTPQIKITLSQGTLFNPVWDLHAVDEPRWWGRRSLTEWLCTPVLPG
jgi:hypothetical protein